MNHLNVFFNARIHSTFQANKLTEYVNLAGDICLVPCKYLFNGKSVSIIEYKDSSGLTVEDKPIYSRRNKFLHTIAAIALFVPGLIFGTVLKGISYLSSTIREKHRLAVLHFTPFKEGTVIGSEDKRLNLQEITDQLKQVWELNPIDRPTPSLTIYAQPGTKIKEDPGILDLYPQKLILVDAKIVHGPSAGLSGCLDENLDHTWDVSSVRVVNADNKTSSFATQRKVNSVAEALKDVPPRLSLFSFERYKRIYVVETTQT